MLIGCAAGFVMAEVAAAAGAVRRLKVVKRDEAMAEAEGSAVLYGNESSDVLADRDRGMGGGRGRDGRAAFAALARAAVAAAVAAAIAAAQAAPCSESWAVEAPCADMAAAPHRSRAAMLAEAG